MNETKQALEYLVDKDLTGFKVIKMTEVYRHDEDGRPTKSLGFFRDKLIAEAFAKSQTDSGYHKTHEACVLTNGTVGFVIKDQDPIKLFDDEAEALALKERALAKLSPAERHILGL